MPQKKGQLFFGCQKTFKSVVAVCLSFVSFLFVFLPPMASPSVGTSVVDGVCFSFCFFFRSSLLKNFLFVVILFLSLFGSLQLFFFSHQHSLDSQK